MQNELAWLRLNFPPQFIASIANNGIKNDAIERLSSVHQIRIDEYCGRRNSLSPHKFQVQNRRLQSTHRITISICKDELFLFSRI